MPANRLPKQIEAIDEQMAAILRAKTEAQRLAIVWGLWRMGRDLIRANLRGEHPDWSEEKIHREAARRLSHGSV